MHTRCTILFLFAPGWASAQTTVTGVIQSGGRSRNYRLYIPAVHTGNTAAPWCSTSMAK